jgi:hypothetical protein
MATAFVLGPQGCTVTLVLHVWVSLTSYSHIVQREPVLRGEGPRFVGRQCALAPSLGHFTSKHGGLVSVSVLGLVRSRLNHEVDSVPKCRT